jgi:selenocysteine-specific elongation factor
MRSELTRLSDQLVALVAAHHRTSPHEPGLSDETLRQALRVPPELAAAALAQATQARRLKLVNGIATVPPFVPTPRASEAERERLLALIRAGGLMAPSVGELERLTTHDSRLSDDLRLTTEAILRDLAREGRLTPVAPGWYLAPEALAGFADLLRQVGQVGEITPGALRDRTGLSRKYLIPLLEWADRTGITQREGEGRRLRPARKS